MSVYWNHGVLVCMCARLCSKVSGSGVGRDLIRWWANIQDMGNVPGHGFNQHKHNGNVMCWDGSGDMGSGVFV
jgi:hypothetical protein